MENINPFSGIIDQMRSQKSETEKARDQNREIISTNKEIIHTINENSTLEKNTQSILERIYAILQSQLNLQKSIEQEQELQRNIVPKELETKDSEEDVLIKKIDELLEEQKARKLEQEETGIGGMSGGTSLLATVAGIATSLTALIGIVTTIKNTVGLDGFREIGDAITGAISERGISLGMKPEIDRTRRKYHPDETPELKGNSRNAQAMNYFMEKGWSKEEAAAIIGNLREESGNFSEDVLSGKRKGDKGTAAGVAQWRGERQTLFKRKYGEDLNKGASFENQLDYINYELTEGKYKKVGQRLKSAKTLEEKTGIINADYEVSAKGRRGDHTSRIKLARESYNQNYDDVTSYAKEEREPISKKELQQISNNLSIKKAHKAVDVEHLDAEYAKSLNEFILDAEKEFGKKLTISSGFRAPTAKEKIALGSKGSIQPKKTSGKVASTYGSMHGLGKAVDLGWEDNGYGSMNNMSASDKQKWKELADKHNLNLPMLPGKVDSKNVEWWHLESANIKRGGASKYGLKGQNYIDYINRNSLKTALNTSQEDIKYASASKISQETKPKEIATRVEDVQEKDLNELIRQEIPKREQSNNLTSDVYQQTNVNDLIGNYGVSPFGGGIYQPQQSMQRYPFEMTNPKGNVGYGISTGIGYGMMGRNFDFKNNPIGSMYSIQGMIRGILGINGRIGEQSSPVLDGAARTVGGIGQGMQTGRMIGQMGRFSGNYGVLGTMNATNGVMGLANGIAGLGQSIISGFGGMFGNNRIPQTPLGYPSPTIPFGYGVTPTMPSQVQPSVTRFGKELGKTPKVESDPFEDFRIDINKIIRENEPIPTPTRFGKELGKTPKVESEPLKEFITDVESVIKKNDSKYKGELFPNQTTRGRTLEGMTLQANNEKEQQMSPANVPPPIINVNGDQGGGQGGGKFESGGRSMETPSPDSVMGSIGMTFRSDDPTIWHIMYGNARSV